MESPLSARLDPITRQRHLSRGRLRFALLQSFGAQPIHSTKVASFSNFLSFLLPSKPPPPLPPLAQTLLKQRQSGASVSVSQAKDQSPVPAAVDLSAAVMCPSLAYANTLYFSSGYNVQVFVEDNEPEERLLGRFRREVMKAGVIQECKRRRFFENSQDERKRKQSSKMGV